MAQAMMAKQLHAMFPTRVGLLADITGALKQAGVNIRAICAYEFEGRGEFMMVTDDNAKATEAMTALGGQVEESDVVAVELPDRVGALDDVAQAIGAAGINILMTYATTGGGDTAAVILSTADDTRVLELLGA